jgi:hypothetical protein
VFAVAVVVVAPINVTVAPDPPVPLIVPLIVKVCAELKFAVALAPFIVTAWFPGVNMKPVLAGVTVYEPFVKLLNVKTPEVFAVVVAVAAPPRLIVAPFPPVPLMVPVIVKVWAVELKLADAFAPLTVTDWFKGETIKPDLVGVTVYDPLVRPEKV